MIAVYFRVTMTWFEFGFYALVPFLVGTLIGYLAGRLKDKP